MQVKYIFYTLLLLVLIFVGYNLKKSFFPTSLVNQTIVNNLETKTPTVDDQNHIPVNTHIIAVAVIKKPTPNRFIKDDPRIVVVVDNKCNTCTHIVQIDKPVTYFGFVNEPKAYMGYSNNKLLMGYSQGFFRYGRYSTDAILGFPAVGLGLSYSITNNLAVTAGAVFEYLSYQSISNLSTYTTGDMTTPRLTLGLTLNLM